MKAYEFTIEMDSRSLDDCYVFIHNSDAHTGNAHSDEKLQEEVVKRIVNDRKCWWWDTGDALECIQGNDPRFENGDVPEWFDFKMMSDPVKHQKQRHQEIWSPAIDKCLATVMGNHEFAIQKHSYRTVYNDLWEEMGLPEHRRFGINGILRLRFMFADRVFWRQDVYLFHGTANGKGKSGILNELERLPMSHQADVYCLGHAHKRVVSMDEYSVMDHSTNRVMRRNRHYSAAGAYLVGITDTENGQWSERRGFYPQGIGPVEIKFYPNRKEIRMVL
jgi:predicted phosphodiesterase